MANYTCIFAHYNPRGEISEYVLTYCRALAELDFHTIFISNSPVSAPFLDRLKTVIPGSIIRERQNTGYAFGAWQWALEQGLVPENTDNLVLTNDSVFGPVSGIGPILKEMSNRPGIDFWGLTDSWSEGWYLHSYFLCLSKKAFASEPFKKIFSRNFNGSPEEETTQKAEVLLTKELSAAGLRGETYIPYKKADPDADPEFIRDLTLLCPSELIADHNFPFINRQLFFRNPENFPRINELLAYIGQISSVVLENIREALIEAARPVISHKHKGPSITVLCHLFYPSTIYHFLLQLAPLSSYDTLFIFNLSASLFSDPFFLDLLEKSFPGCVILHSPNKGRDIGGKLSAIDALIKLKSESEFSLIIHDKMSPHSHTGIAWRDALFTIIQEHNLPSVFQSFEQNKETGVIVTREFIKNEYNPDKGNFSCSSSDNIMAYIKNYELNLSNYNFAAGTIFWIRTGILRKFFGSHPPLSIREGLEAGNALDFMKGTNIHAWERLFSFIAINQGFKVKGI